MKYLFIFTLLLSCATAPVKTDRLGESVFVNLGERLPLFWKNAKDKPIEEQIELWDKYIEADYEHFFNDILWYKDKNKKWQEYKKHKLQIAFQVYKENESLLLNKSHLIIEEKLKKEMKFFKDFFKDAKFKGLFFILPFGLDLRGALTFHNDEEKEHKRTVMLIASDTLSFVPDKIPYIFTHELFHFYVYNKVGGKLKMDKFDAAKFLTYLLYHEGFALYAAAEMNVIRGQSSYTLDKEHEVLIQNFHKKYPGVNQRIYLQEHCLNLNFSKVFGFKRTTCADLYNYSLKLMEVVVRTYGIDQTIVMDLDQIKLNMISMLEQRKKDPISYELLQVLTKK